MRILIIGADGTIEHRSLVCRELHRKILHAGADVATNRSEVEIDEWPASSPIQITGWTSILIDQTSGLWETSRLGRRAARRQRGRARAARRAVAARL